MGLGLLLAIFGPLLFIPIVWAIYRWITKPFIASRLSERLGKVRATMIGITAAATPVAVAMAISYLPGKLAFDDQCAQHSVPEVLERVAADGYCQTRLAPYEVNRILGEWGFAYVEAPDMYRPGVYVRCSKAADGRVGSATFHVPPPAMDCATSSSNCLTAS